MVENIVLKLVRAILLSIKEEIVNIIGMYDNPIVLSINGNAASDTYLVKSCYSNKSEYML